MSKSAKKQPIAARITTEAPARRTTRDLKEKTRDRGSKQSHVIAMLQSTNGATIAAMMKTTGWQQHSVRGFLAGIVRKRLKLKLDSKLVDGERVYRVASVPNSNLGEPRVKRAAR